MVGMGFTPVESNALIGCCDVNYDDLKNCDVHCKYILASGSIGISGHVKV